MDDLDVVVVGGGPGGSAAAISCAQAGLTVTLLEQACFPRNHPGETLHPGVEPILQKLGVWDAVQAAGFLRHTGHYSEWFTERKFEVFGSDALGKWLGFQAWRADLDAILLNQARLTGVRVIQPCRALRPIILSDRVTGVKTHEAILNAKFIIDATGSTRWLERHLGLSVNYLTPKLIACYGYMSGECPARDEAPLIIADAEGWTWTARVRPNLYQWTRLNLAQKTIRKHRFPSEFAEMKPIGSVKSVDVTWRMGQDVAGPGYFIIGDAAAALDPASSHGVLKALMSGIMAAHLIVKSMGSRIQTAAQREQVGDSLEFEAYGTKVYRKWLESWFLTDTNRLRQLYAQFPCTSNWLPH